MVNKYKAQAKEARQARRRRACERKRRYTTREDAYQQGQRIYQCPVCNGWHRSGELMRLVKRHGRKASR